MLLSHSRHSKCTLCLAIFPCDQTECKQMVVDMTRRSHCNMCMMSSVGRKAIAPDGGFFLHMGFFGDQVWAHLL